MIFFFFLILGNTLSLKVSATSYIIQFMQNTTPSNYSDFAVTISNKKKSLRFQGEMVPVSIIFLIYFWSLQWLSHSSSPSKLEACIFSVKLFCTYIKLTNVYFVSFLILLLRYRYQKSLSNLRNNDSFSRLNNAFNSLTSLFLILR